MNGGYDWAAIKDAHPIVDVIGKTVALKKVGDEYKGLCPFHAEKSPSFHVIPEKGFFHCFGCSAHGDALDFVAKTQGLSARDAIAALTGGSAYTLTAEDKAARSAALKAREAEAARERKAAILFATRRWDAADYAGDLHPYLVRKGVPAHSCRIEGDNLLLPIYDAAGDLQSVQTIAGDGAKKFHPGAPTKAGRAYIGVHMGRTIIAEGYATAASIYAAMPDQVCIAYSKGNMAVVARELAGAGVSIMLAADTGAAADMRALGAELGCPVAVPDTGGDFNDQAAASGTDNVRATLDKALRDHAAGAVAAKALGGLPFALDGVCLKTPPGFVGELAAWIESQNRRPRPNLAVAGALVAMGNIAGMRVTDARDGVTANLFAFCIAGSRTGKESVQQAVMELHRAAGCAAATHGNIKSEQEIIRNLTRHQAAMYVIDEIGIMLQKIASAQKRGGAAYLEGVIGVLMSVYSKASGFLLLSGDVKEDVRKALIAESAGLSRKIDDGATGPYIEHRLAAIQATLDALDHGLERPFLSLLGFTTPVTFDDLVDFQTATNGFVGRALLFNERDTAPRSKRGLVRPPLPEHIALRLAGLHNGGDMDTGHIGRVEWRGDIARLPTSPDAEDMLDAALDWFEDQAIVQKGVSGLESLFLGAYELVGKVSLILAVPEGLRSADHVRWAFALVKRDVEEKMRLVIGNDRAKDAPGEALQARIANAISGDDGETLAVIVNRLRMSAPAQRGRVEACIADMADNGAIEITETGKLYKGKPVLKYRHIG
jgi:phage/plasmid primase-like uncharacterized protein